MAKSSPKKLPPAKKTVKSNGAKSTGTKSNKPSAAKVLSAKAGKTARAAKPVIVPKPTKAAVIQVSGKAVAGKTLAKAPPLNTAAKAAPAKADAGKMTAKPNGKVLGKPSAVLTTAIKPGTNSKAMAAKAGSTGRPAAAPVKPEYVSLPDRVATNLKPRKNQAGLTSKELEHFRDLLLEKRREIVGDMSSMEREALRSGSSSNLSTLPIHMADMGTDNYEQEFTLGLVEKDRNLLREINNALAKIQNGTFGICEGTNKPIPKARLEVQPWARFGVEYARQMEKGMMGVR